MREEKEDDMKFKSILTSKWFWLPFLALLFIFLAWRLGAVGKAVDLASALLAEKQTKVINELKTNLQTSLEKQKAMDNKLKTNEAMIKKLQRDQEALKKGVEDVKKKIGDIVIPTTSVGIADDLRKHGISSAIPARRPK